MSFATSSAIYPSSESQPSRVPNGEFQRHALLTTLFAGSVLTALPVLAGLGRVVRAGRPRAVRAGGVLVDLGFVTFADDGERLAVSSADFSAGFALGCSSMRAPTEESRVLFPPPVRATSVDCSVLSSATGIPPLNGS